MRAMTVFMGCGCVRAPGMTVSDSVTMRVVSLVSRFFFGSGANVPLQGGPLALVRFPIFTFLNCRAGFWKPKSC